MSGAAPLVRIRHVLRSLRAWGRRLIAFGCLLVAVFALVGLVQHQYVHSRFLGNVDAELVGWASEIASEITTKDGWNLADYRRRASVFAPRWWVIAKDGLIVDVTGLTPALFKHVRFVDEPQIGVPATVVTSIGEPWRLLSKRIDHGIVMVGIASPEDIPAADTKLTRELAKFGTTIAEAAAIRERQTDQEVDYAVINTNGALINGSGGVPLVTDLNELPVSGTGQWATTINENDRSYRLLSLPIRWPGSAEAVASIVVPKDITGELQALADQDRFNFMLAGGSLGLVVLSILAFVLREFWRDFEAPTVAEALRVGESKTVEFKSTYHWDVELAAHNDQLRYEVLKAIVAFLNTDGGTIYIGVEEDNAGKGTVRGIAEDVQIERGNIDRLRRNLFDLITDKIGKHVAPYITDRIETIEGALCWVVTVKQSPVEAFIRWKDPSERKERPHFFVRRGPSTTELENGDLSRYVRKRFA
jgi:hypothetical protein